MGKRAARYGRYPTQKKIAQPVTVQGVGQGAQQAAWETTTPIAMPTADGSAVSSNYVAPTIMGSTLPPLLGLKSMKAKNAVIDTMNNKLYFCGPGGCEIRPSPGTVVIPLEQTRSGHLVAPCSHFDEVRSVTQQMERDNDEDNAIPMLPSFAPATSSNEPVGATTVESQSPSTTTRRRPSAFAATSGMDLPSPPGLPPPLGVDLPPFDS